jgi:lysosomal acid lipase/cholesteryl ester hydrolase
VYGGSDSLVDIKAMLKELPPQTVATEIPHYEHLDFLWARDVDKQVFQHVFDALDSFTDAEHTKEEYNRYFTVREESLVGSGLMAARAHRGSESESSTTAGGNDEGVSDPQQLRHRARERRASAQVERRAVRIRTPEPVDEDACMPSPEGVGPHQKKIRPNTAQSLEGAVESRDDPTPTKLKGTGVRRGSAGSVIGRDSMRDGRGINIGTSKSAGIVVTRNGADAAHSSPDRDKVTSRGGAS